VEYLGHHGNLFRNDYKFPAEGAVAIETIHTMADPWAYNKIDRQDPLFSFNPDGVVVHMDQVLWNEDNEVEADRRLKIWSDSETKFYVLRWDDDSCLYPDVYKLIAVTRNPELAAPKF
jgi:hypothetical protein